MTAVSNPGPLAGAARDPFEPARPAAGDTQITNDPTLDVEELVHELRTPLHRALLAAELLDPDRHETKALRSALAHMHELVELTGGADVTTGSCPVREVVAEAVLVADPTGRVDLVDRLQGERQAPVRSATLRQLVLIICTNALKFSPPDSPVRVELRETDSHAVVSVADQGNGVHDTEKEHIFGRGTRGRGTASVSGSGLGLGIARRLARASGATVTLVQSGPLGSCFEISVPLMPAGPSVVNGVENLKS